MTDTTHTPSLSKLLHLAWPIIVSRSAQTVISVCDALMVAHLGSDALAATTAGALNLIALFILPFGIVFIVSSFVSQFHGRRDPAAARRYGYYGLAVAGIAQLVFFGFIALAPSILSKLGYSPALEKLMLQYIVARLVTGGAAVGLEALANYFGGLGNTRLPMMAQILSMVLNVALCWVLIYGRFGLPELGVLGSGLAASIATLIAFLALLACFLLGFGEPEKAEKTKLRASEFLRMLRVGLPSGLNWFIEFAAFTLFINIVVGGLGTTTFAAFMAAMQINQVAFMPAFGLTTAGSILVGHAIGAKEPDMVPKTVHLTLAVAGGWQGFVGLIYLVFASICILPFAPPGAERTAFLAAGTTMLTLSATWQLFDAASITFAEALRAAGDTAFCAWARGIIAWFIFLPGAYLTVKYVGGSITIIALWLSGYLAMLSFVLWMRFRGGAWRKLDLAGPELPLI